MKKIFAFLSLAAMLAAGCTVAELEGADDVAVNAPTFYASIEGQDVSETKTYIDDQRSMRWTKDDELSIFVGNTLNQRFKYDGETGANSGSFTPLSTPGFVAADPLNANYAVYPYTSATEMDASGKITLTLPAVQTYAENSFGLGANTMVAATENKSDMLLQFKNLCGYLVVKFYGSGTVKSVSIEGNNGEKLAGKATVSTAYSSTPSLVMADNATTSITIDCGDGVRLGTTAETATEFWFCIPPVIFSKGFTVTVSDVNDKVFKKGISSSKSISRNVINSMPSLAAVFGAGLNDIKFDDANFKAYCVSRYDVDGDGEINYEEASKVTIINCQGFNIQSLKGIEFFTSLKELACFANQLTSLDLSKNLALTDLACWSNQLTSLDLNKNTALKRLDCESNLLTSLDVSRNTELTYLVCSYNHLISLDVSTNTMLTDLYCFENQLTSLDVSKNTMLTTLNCFKNQLTSLDVSKNSALKELRCGDNLLTTLDVSKNTLLTYLSCSPMPSLKYLYAAADRFRIRNTIPDISIPSTTKIIVAVPIPEMVDLGLSVKWASFNLGASRPEEYGDYYQYAGLDNVYYSGFDVNWNNCPYHTGSDEKTGWLKYTSSNKSSYWSGPDSPDNKTVLDSEDDVAHVKLSGKWRMPTESEFQELYNNCTSEWTTLNGINGRKFTSTKNGKSIFLPAAGFCGNQSLINVSHCGYYCSSSLFTEDPCYAYEFHFDSCAVAIDHGYGRCAGLSVRPVCE